MLAPPQCEMLFLHRICPIAMAIKPKAMTAMAAIKCSNTLIDHLVEVASTLLSYSKNPLSQSSVRESNENLNLIGLLVPSNRK